jgi:hypothetical protein
MKGDDRSLCSPVVSSHVFVETQSRRVALDRAPSPLVIVVETGGGLLCGLCRCAGGPNMVELE